MIKFTATFEAQDVSIAHKYGNVLELAGVKSEYKMRTDNLDDDKELHYIISDHGEAWKKIVTVYNLISDDVQSFTDFTKAVETIEWFDEELNK